MTSTVSPDYRLPVGNEDDPNSAVIKMTDLEKIEARLNFSLEKAFIASAILEEQDFEYLRDIILAKVRAFVWAEKESVKRYNYSYPVDWWQAVKERWFPQWAKRRWPVRYRNIQIDVRAIYPEFKPKLPETCVLSLESRFWTSEG